MTIPEANIYLSKEDYSIPAAYDTVKLKYSSVILPVDEMFRLHPESRIAKAAGDYFSAGVAYLANRGADHMLQSIGTDAWTAVNKKKAQIALTTNMLAASIELGLPPSIAVKASPKNDEPYILFITKKEGRAIMQEGYVLIPPELLLKANSNPVEALATMVFLCSQLRDLLHGRLDMEQQYTRAVAAESHFLIDAVKKYPNIPVSEVYLQMMDDFPEGINSLPPGVWYSGTVREPGE